MRTRIGKRDPPHWTERVDTLPSPHTFINGSRTDLALVANALILPYSSGHVDGHISRIKMLKRQICGRANFDLLRGRVLAPV